MITKFIEASQSKHGPNWGKFMVARFDLEEWTRGSEIGRGALLREVRIGLDDILVLDLQTCEGVVVRPGGLASADLDNHRVWVCPMFEPFLHWLYQQDLSDLSKLPPIVYLPEAPFALRGYRRAGKA